MSDGCWIEADCSEVLDCRQLTDCKQQWCTESTMHEYRIRVQSLIAPCGRVACEHAGIGVEDEEIVA